MTIPLPPSNHPAPIPGTPYYPPGVDSPPRLILQGAARTRAGERGVCLSWSAIAASQSIIRFFHVYYYPETDTPPHPRIWRRLTIVSHTVFPRHVFVRLPTNQRYHFIVAAEDVNRRCGPFSNAVSVTVQGT